MEIVRLYAAPAARRHAPAPGRAGLMFELPRVRVIAGHELAGGRPGMRTPERKGEITFFAEETWRRLQDELGLSRSDPGVLRRNILVRHADLPALIGRRFALQGVRFQGLGYCAPGPWMDDALWPGAFRLLIAWAAGGLRASALTGGWLVCDAEPAKTWPDQP